MRRRIGQGSNKPVAFLRSDDHICNRTDDADIAAVCAVFDERIEAVLRAHLVAHIARTQRHAQDAPITDFCGHCIVGIGCLMRAMKRADTEMHDANAACIAVICWLCHRHGQTGAVSVRKPHNLYAAFARL